MLINSLFLSKLLNPKTENQSAENSGDGFNYLFSEIIKVKTSEDNSVFIPENIGGTLLDHKTVFISNSSTLEKIKIEKTNKTVTEIENLFKLFLEPTAQTGNVNAKENLSVNKITTDKKQFIHSIEKLIQNILINSDNQISNVEVRYVQKNLIETIKLNEKNLPQFAEYLSGLIENNSAFSFVIGANAKQILFDVENVNSENTSIQSIATETQSQTELELKTSSKNESDKIIQLSNLSNENSQQKDNSIKTYKADYELVNDKFNRQPIESKGKFELDISDLAQESDKSEQLINNVEKKLLSKEENKTLKPKTEVSFDNYNGSELNKVSEGAVNKSSDKNQLSQSKTDLKSKIQIKFETDNNSDEVYLNNKSQKFDFPNDKNIGEVKIVIKTRTTENNPVNNISHNFTQAVQKENSSSNNQVDSKHFTTHNIQNATDGKNKNFVSNLLNNKNYESDLPEVTSANGNEPRISRAGLPLIADYQDWDLVFEKTEKVKTIPKQNDIKVSDSEQYQIRRSVTEEHHNNSKSEALNEKISSINSQKESLLQNKISAKGISQSELDESGSSGSNNKLEINEKVFSLKLSGEKKITDISHYGSDITKEILEIKKNTNSAEKNHSNISSEHNEKVFASKNIEHVNEKPKSEKNYSGNEKERVNNTEKIEAKNNHNNNDDLSNDKENLNPQVGKETVKESKLTESEFRNEFQTAQRQEFIPASKTTILNNKNIVEHFIKNPVESRTLEKFIHILEKQETIQRSEIVSYSKQNHSVEIRLAPEDLGTIKILLNTNDNNVNAKIEVNSEQTKVIVVNNLPQLKETLSQQGVNLNNVNVTVTSEEHKGSEQTKQKSKKKSQERGSKIENTDQKRTLRNLGYNTYEYLA
ncbi:flagellar hook-length control protein FliK [Ignavibacterium sp.]|uniref:flagellar hook-length control protein FliK n=1 Tax=Ignavibacterium sp. TaxID=2651167 RepID=UPI00307F6BFB